MRKPVRRKQPNEVTTSGAKELNIEVLTTALSKVAPRAMALCRDMPPAAGRVLVRNAHHFFAVAHAVDAVARAVEEGDELTAMAALVTLEGACRESQEDFGRCFSEEGCTVADVQACFGIIAEVGVSLGLGQQGNALA